jgi:type III pantothenate kinase
MFLAIDIGNTHTVLGVYRKSKLIAHWRIASAATVTEKELASLNQTFFAKEKIDPADIESVGISSVVPALTETYAAMSKFLFHQMPLLINSDLDLGIKIHYENPGTLGTDRICDAIAGHANYHSPLIIIDFGTATTYNVIAANGDFLGGVIAPGIGTMAAALHQRTAKLPDINLQLPKTIIGTTTVNSMQSGVLWSAVDGTAGMVKRLQKELHKTEKKKATVIATGGFSDFISKHSTVIQHVEPFLVLDGIRLIYERAQKTKKKKR